MHSNLASGAVREHRLAYHYGTACLERCQHASLDSVDRVLHLRIRDLRTDETQHLWPLQPIPSSRIHAQPSEWRWHGETLALPYGTSKRDTAAAGQETGILLVDASTGSCKRVILPVHVVASPPSAPRLSSWSSGGLQLAEQASRCFVAMVDTAGRILKAAVLPGVYAHYAQVRSCWAPDGQSAVLFGLRKSEVWLWQVTEAEPAPIKLHAIPVQDLTWSTDSSRLLIASETGHVLVWSPEGETLHVPSSFSFGMWRPAWGSQGRAALCGERVEDEDSHELSRALQLCEILQGGELLPTCRLRLQPRMYDGYFRRVSPDGILYAVSTLQPGQGVHGHGVAIINLHTGVQQQFHLGFMPDSMQWSATSLLVLRAEYGLPSSSGRYSLLIDLV